MKQDELLTILKKDLQMITDANDDYLIDLLSFAQDLMEREGIIYSEDLECQMIQIHYAAYLFRRRGGTETTIQKIADTIMGGIKTSQKKEVETKTKNARAPKAI